MVERGGEKKQDHAAAIQVVAGDGHYVCASVHRLHQQQYQADNAEYQPNAVADAVGNLLRPRIRYGGDFLVANFFYALFPYSKIL